MSHKNFSLVISQMPEGILVISQALKVDLVSQSKPLLHPLYA